jgi:hypothetical protein
MSVLGPLETSLLQAAQAQQAASRARDREQAARDSAARRFRDLVELRVGSVEAAQALRKLPANESEQAEVEHRAHSDGEDPPPGRVDVQA